MDRNRIVLRAAVVASALLAWHLGAAVAGSFVPGPVPVADALMAIIASGTFSSAVLVTTARVLAAIGLIVIIGGGLALLSTRSTLVDIITDDILFTVTYSMPSILWVFIVLIILGLSPVAPVLIVALIAMPHFIINIREGLTDLDAGIGDVGTVFGTSDLAVLRHVIVPQLYPNIIAGLRSVMSTAWKAIIIAEVFTATDGIGYRVNEAFTRYDVTTLIAWGIIVLAIMLGIDGMLRRLDRTVLRRYRHLRL